MTVKTLTEEQIAWEKDWVKRLDEAMRTKSKARLRPFFKGMSVCQELSHSLIVRHL